VDRVIRIGLRLFVAAAPGGVGWFLNWLVIAAASVWLISNCRQAASVSRSWGPAGATFFRRPPECAREEKAAFQVEYLF
jgi:hypothetical protein